MRSIRDRKTVIQNTESDAKSQTDALADKYTGKSESELMQLLVQNVSAAKRDGTFSAQQLDEFVRFVSPSLDEKSRARLKELVLMIGDR